MNATMRFEGTKTEENKQKPLNDFSSNAQDTIALIMSLAESENTISFAGGFPAEQLEDQQKLRELTHETLVKENRSIFGYSPTPGISELRSLLAEYMLNRGRASNSEEIVVTSGGVAALDLFTSAILNDGDTVVTTNPTYMGALHTFENHNIEIKAVAADMQGFNLAELEDCLKKQLQIGKSVKCIYTIPSFDNPTGVVVSHEHRLAFLDIAKKYDVIVLEDGAYQDIYFDKPPPPMLAALEPDYVVHINTFSKIFCPGFRLGWIAARSEIVNAIVKRKQTWDQCSSTFGQQVVVTAMKSGYIEKLSQSARLHYKQRRDVLLSALTAELKSLATWNTPQGGFYVWLKLGKNGNAVELAKVANRNHVAVIPGACFYHGAPDLRTIRLSYSFVDIEKIHEGINILRKSIEN